MGSEPKTFAWRWLLAGVLLMIAASLAGWYLTVDLLRDLLRHGRVGAALLTSVGTTLGFFFVGGLVLARLSASRLWYEPAVAAVVALVALFVIQLTSGMLNVVWLLFGGPLCFGAALLGTGVGTRWHARWRQAHAGREPAPGSPAPGPPAASELEQR